MAIVQCKECGHGHSKEAKACPKCGKPNAAQQAAKKFMQVLVSALLAGAIVFGIFWYMSQRAGRQADHLRDQRSQWLNQLK